MQKSQHLLALTIIVQKVLCEQHYTLSKQIRLSWPQMLILCGLMQKMPRPLRRRCAYTIPAVMAAGSAGGTVMVMMSSDSMMMVLAETYTNRNNPAIKQSCINDVQMKWKWRRTVLPYSRCSVQSSRQSRYQPLQRDKAGTGRHLCTA